jgi:ATP synthase protein I
MAILDSPGPNQYVPRGLEGAGRFDIVFLHRGCRHMSDDTGGKNDPDRRLSDEAALSARLRHLGDQLDKHRASQPSEPTPTPAAADSSALARGMRLSSELVGGVLVGAVIGYLVDLVPHVRPWGFIVFVLLGFAAGMLNLMRAAGFLAKPGDRGR